MPSSRILRPTSLHLPFLYPSLRPLTLLPSSLLCNQPNLPANQLPSGTRHASHKTEGRANRASRGAGKRLGLKRAASELVVPGTILYRQRGTKWFPGENVGMGRDHTLFAKEKGYVVYYLGKWRGLGYNGAGRIRAEGNKGRGGMHYKRYVGIVFEKGETLPYPEGSERRRRLGMVTRARKDFGQETSAPIQDVSGLTEAAGTIASVTKNEREIVAPTAARNYQIRETNTSIGRVMEEAEKRVRRFKRGDRWLAWRKRSKRVQAAKALKAQKKQRKGKGAAKAARSGDTTGA